MTFPGEKNRCARCNRVTTWLVNSRTGLIAAVDDDLRFGGNVERDGNEYTVVAPHPAEERYTLHGLTCGRDV